MGDVLVYVDPAINTRLRAFARPLAEAAGGALVALVASGEPAGADGLEAADVVLEVSHPALSPYLPETHLAVLTAAIAARAPDLVLGGGFHQCCNLAGRGKVPKLPPVSSN